MGLRGAKTVPGFADVLAQSRLPSAMTTGPSLASIGAASGGKGVGLAALERMASGLIQTGLEAQAENAKQEGALAGAQAAEQAFTEDGRPRGLAVRADGTIWGQAFDQAQAAAYLAKLDMNSTDLAARLSMEHPDDPNAWKQKWQGVGQEWIATLPADMQPGARLSWEQKGAKALSHVNLAAHKKVLDEANATLMASMDRSLTDSANALRLGRGNDAAQAQEKYMQALSARTDLSKQQIEKARLDFADEAKRQSALGAFDRAKKGGLGSAEKFIADFLHPANNTDLHPDFKTKIGAEMHRDLAELKAENALAKADLREQARDAAFRVEHGRPAPQLADLAKRARQLGDVALAADLTDMVDQEKTLADIRIQPLGLQVEAVKSLSAKADQASDKSSVVLAERARKMVANAQAAFQPGNERFDPLGQAQASGQTKLDGVDFSNADSLAQRAIQAETVKSFNKLSYDPPPFTAAEAFHLAQTLDGQTREQKAATLGTLSNGLGPRHFAAAMAQIAPQQPMLAQAGSMMAEGDAKGAENQILGDELRKGIAKGTDAAPRQFAPPKDDLMRASLLRHMPVQLFADLGPQFLADAQASVMNAYVAKSWQRGLANQTVIDDALMAEAAREVSGGFVRLNKSTIFAPKRGQSQADFDKMMAGLSDDAFQGFYNAKGKPVTAAMVRNNAQLSTLSRGRYLVRIQDYTLLDADGQPAVLDLRDRGR